MKREDVKKLFPDATDEQITNLLNQHHAELSGEKAQYQSELSTLRENAEKADELQRKIDEIEQGKLTESEKMSKELQKANNRIAELEKNIAISNQKIELAKELRITTEQVDKVVKPDGTLDYKILGQLVAEKESASALAKEQEIAAQSINSVGQGIKDDDTSSLAEERARNLANQQKDINQDILNFYRR